MLRKNLFTKSLVFVLILSLLSGSALFAAEDKSLFQKLKEKAARKIELLQNKDYLAIKGGEKAGSFLVGKSVGLAGMGIGALLGVVAGPAGVVAGSALGYRLAQHYGSTFGGAAGEILAQRKMAGQPLEVKSALKAVDLKGVAVAGTGSVLGDFIGEALGIAIGVALFAGTGPIAVPILGVMSLAYIGKKLGGLIGKSIGGNLGKRATTAGYRSFFGKKESGTAQPVANSTVSNAPISFSTPPALGLASAQAPLDPKAQTLKSRYEAAYKAYVAAQGDVSLSGKTRGELLETYCLTKAEWEKFQKGQKK